MLSPSDETTLILSKSCISCCSSSMAGIRHCTEVSSVVPSWLAFRTVSNNTGLGAGSTGTILVERVGRYLLEEKTVD